jgi:hypothetical protein
MMPIFSFIRQSFTPAPNMCHLSSPDPPVSYQSVIFRFVFRLIKLPIVAPFVHAEMGMGTDGLQDGKGSFVK